MGWKICSRSSVLRTPSTAGWLKSQILHPTPVAIDPYDHPLEGLGGLEKWACHIMKHAPSWCGTPEGKVGPVCSIVRRPCPGPFLPVSGPYTISCTGSLTVSSATKRNLASLPPWDFNFLDPPKKRRTKFSFQTSNAPSLPKGSVAIASAVSETIIPCATQEPAALKQRIPLIIANNLS